GAFSPRDVELLLTIAGPLAISINNIRQLEQTQAALMAQSEQALLLRTATEVSATATSVLDVQELAQRVVNLIQERFDLYYAGLFLVDEGQQEAILQAGTEAEGTALQAEQYRLPLASSALVTQAITVGRVHLEPDVRQGTNWEFGAYLPNTRSMLAIPLRAQRGGTVGALTVHSTEVDAFSDQAISILQTLCDQLAVAIENARLFQQVQESLIRLNNLFLASRKIMAAERAQTVYETLVDYAGASGLVDMAHLLVADPKEPDFLMLPALWSRLDVQYDPTYRYARDPLPYSPRLLQKDVVFIEDLQQISNNEPAILEMFQSSRMHAVVLVPIYREDQWLGSLVLARSDSKPLARSEVQPFLTLCNQAAAALANQQLFRESTALYRASRSLSQVITRDDAINTVAEEIMLQTKADQCRLILYDSRAGVGKIEYERSETGLASGIQFPMGDDPIFRRLSEERRPLLLHDDGQDEITAASYLRPFHTKLSLLIPALNQQNLIGFMALDLLQGHRNFNSTQVNFAQTLVDQLNTQLENLALFDDALSRAQEMITLNQVGVLISGTLDLDQLANVVHEQVGRLLDNSIFILALYEAETQLYRPLLCTRYGERIAPEPRRLEKSESLYEFLYRGTLLAVPDDPVLSEEAGLQELFVSGWVPESALWVPMQQEGEPIGFLSVQSYRPDAYTENHIQLLRTIATQAGLALANAQSFQRTETTLQEIRQLFEITQIVTAAPEPQTRLARVVDALHRHFQEVNIALFTVNDEEKLLETVISHGRQSFPRQIPIADDLLGQSVVRGKPLLIRDMRDLPAHEQSSRDALSQIIIPLAFGARVIGVLTVESPFPDAFSDSDLRLLRTLSVSVAATLESGRLFQEIQLANEQLRELDRLKTQFLANMSHELRTPLNSIIGFSRVILKGIVGPVTPEQEHDLTAIYNSGRHLLTLINDILDIARIEAGKMALILEEVDVKEVALDALTTTRGLVQDSGVELRTDFAPHLPLIDADPVRLRQILLNLLSNAAKFTSEGHIQLEIFPDGEHHLHIAVQDTGIGLAETDFGRIFTAFEQIEKRDGQSLRGTGLGLPITKRLVDMHQGEIWVESELGQGATFHVVLPVKQLSHATNGQTDHVLEVSEESSLP
ncbi:MAG: GAF domain-containing protein, partial [Anaerolineales bacterium]|nr:GAF domain-containing protein [Anaerolineales bacterium]